MSVRRRVLAAALLVLGGLAVVAAGVATWARATVVDRDGFVDALRPLAADDDVVDGLVAELADRVLALQPAADRADAELRAVVEDGLRVVLTGPLADSMWTEAIRPAHDQVERLVRSGGRRVELDAGAVLTRLDDLLEGQGHDLLDDERIERIDDIVVTRRQQVAVVVGAIGAVERLAVVLPFVALGLFAAVVALARRRALAAAVSGAVVAAAALATLVMVMLARSLALGRVDAGPRRSAAGAVWDALLDPLRPQMLILLGAGLVVAAGAAVLDRLAAPGGAPDGP